MTFINTLKTDIDAKGGNWTDAVNDAKDEIEILKKKGVLNTEQLNTLNQVIEENMPNATPAEIAATQTKVAAEALELSLGDKSTTVQDLGDVTGAVTVDFSKTHHVRMKLTGDVTLSFTDPVEDVVSLFIHFEQDATGDHTVTYPTLLGETPEIEAEATVHTVLPVYFDGTNYHV